MSRTTSPTHSSVCGPFEMSDAGLRVLPRGRLLIRNICMPFDRYLGGQTMQRFSKVI